MSYDKFKQFRLNEKLLQQTVLIRNAIKMLQYDIQFQQEQEQQMLIQQQQAQQHHQQQQLMEYDNSINRTINITTAQSLNNYLPNNINNQVPASYDNLEDFLTRSEFTNSSMLNSNRLNINQSSGSPLSPQTLTAPHLSNLSSTSPNQPNNNVNTISCYYVNTNSIITTNHEQQQHQIQLYNHATLNENIGNMCEENVDVENEEDEEEEDEDDDDEEVEEDDEDDEEDEEEEEGDEDELEDDECSEESTLELTNLVTSHKEEKLNENKENQINNIINSNKKYNNCKNAANTSASITITNDDNNNNEPNNQHMNTNDSTDYAQEESANETFLKTNSTTTQITVNQNLIENENYLDFKIMPSNSSLVSSNDQKAELRTIIKNNNCQSSDSTDSTKIKNVDEFLLD